MKHANCPQCGADVKFHAAASVLAVCEYCTSTLMRNGEALEHIGKMAELQDDPTLIQIGTEGVYKGVHFGVIGRIQLKYAAGLWNEWHIMFDDMKTGWLGEAAGEFYSRKKSISRRHRSTPSRLKTRLIWAGATTP